jgi:hypothetical protein
MRSGTDLPDDGLPAAGLPSDYLLPPAGYAGSLRSSCEALPLGGNYRMRGGGTVGGVITPLFSKSENGGALDVG